MDDLEADVVAWFGQGLPPAMDAVGERLILDHGTVEPAFARGARSYM